MNEKWPILKLESLLSETRSFFLRALQWANKIEKYELSTLVPHYLRYLLITFFTIYGQFFKDFADIFSYFMKNSGFFFQFFRRFLDTFCRRSNLEFTLTINLYHFIVDYCQFLKFFSLFTRTIQSPFKRR